MKKNKFVKNLKIFSAVVILSVSSYNMGDIVSGTNEFHETIESEQNFDDLGNYVLQGLCKVDDKYLLSAYDYSHNKKSILYILNEDLNFYRIKVLDSYSHVGGVTYDPKNEIVWVTDSDGWITAYDKEEILDDTKIETTKRPIYVGEELQNIFGDYSAAYITYNDDKLYVGNFNFKHNNVIKEYDIEDDGLINPREYKKYKIGRFIQGITFYEDDNDKKYLIVSSSFGRHFNSELEIYDFNTLEKIKDIKTMEMMQEIIVDDDKLITVYESNAKTYKKNDSGKDIIISNIDKILSKK